MGGFNGRTRLNSAERYDPVLNQWTLIAPMNMMRSDANAAALSDKVISTITVRHSQQYVATHRLSV